MTTFLMGVMAGILIMALFEYLVPLVAHQIALHFPHGR